MTEEQWQKMDTQLAEELQEFRQQLARRGIQVRADTTAPIPQQVLQIQQDVLAYFALCQTQISNIRQSDTARRESIKQLQRFIKNAPVAIAMFDRKMRYLAVSARWMSDYGLDERNIIGQSHYEVFPEIGDEWKAVHQRALAGETIRATNERFVRVDGSVQWLRWEVRPWYQDDGNIGGVVLFTEDITDLKLVDERLQRQNRALRLLSATNEALIRAKSEGALLQRVCEVAIEAGGYCMAWVGYTEQSPAKSIRPIAHAGKEGGYLSRHTFSWDETTPEGRGPIGQAITARRPVFAEDISSDPLFSPWREDALAQGYRSAIVLPLITNDDVLGVCVLYRGEPYRFTDGECELLMELANDLAFGIISQRTRTARQQAEDAQRKSEAQYRTIVETAQEGIWIFDRDLRVTYTNQHLAEMLGYQPDELLGRLLYDFIAPEMQLEMAKHMERRRQGLQEVYEFRFRRRDGSEIWTLASGTPLLDEQGRFAGTFAMLTDITERHYAEAYQREFARRTIESATEGKLLISERAEIERIAGPPLAVWDIQRVEDLETIRHAVTEIVRSAGMEEDRIHDLLLCISEAATNAYKHAGRGQCSLHRVDGAFFIVVADRGPGIMPLHLPELALKAGYTTGVSLGMGYKAIIFLADKVYLATGPDGTMVGIQMGVQPAPPPPLTFPGVSEDW